MQENFIHFLSIEPAIININSKELGIINNTTILEQDIITNCKTIYVTYTPISNNNIYMPYTFQLNTENNVYSNSTNIQIIPYPNQQWDIILRPIEYSKTEDTKTILSKTIDKYYISAINNNKTSIFIYSNQNIVFSKTTQLLSNIKVDIQKNTIIIEGVIDNNSKEKYYILVIDTSTFSIMYEDICESIDISNESIKTAKNIHDIQNHIKINKIDFLSKSHDIYYTYPENNDINIQNTHLIPKAFMQCLIAHDERKLRMYLSSKYKETTLQQLNHYFGNIDDIHLNRHTHTQGVINYTILSDGKYKNYDFIVEDNTIIDIIEKDIN